MPVRHECLLWQKVIVAAVFVTFVLASSGIRAASLSDETSFPLDKLPEEFIYDHHVDSLDLNEIRKTVIRKNDTSYKTLQKFFPRNSMGGISFI